MIAMKRELTMLKKKKEEKKKTKFSMTSLEHSLKKLAVLMKPSEEK